MADDEPGPRQSTRWAGWKALTHDAVDATVSLVREGHESAARIGRFVTDRLGPEVAGTAEVVDGARRLWLDGILGTVSGVNRAVEAVSDAAIDAGIAAMLPPSAAGPPIPLRSDVAGTSAWLEDAALGLVNGVFGDRLGARTAPLDLASVLRHGDAYLGPATVIPPREDRPHVVVLVHGLATTEWSWVLGAEAYHGDPAATFGTMLERDLGLEPVYARFNTGRPIEVNGASLAERLEALAQAWNPERIVLVCHSLGGLVARAAGEAAKNAGHTWLGRWTDFVTLSTPHPGAPLAALADLGARGLGSLEHPATQVLARILEARSPGIQALKEAATSGLPEVRCTFLAATASEGPVGTLVGDLLVRVPSASGPETHRERVTLGTFPGVLHHQVQCHPAVYAAVRSVLAHGGG